SLPRVFRSQSGVAARPTRSATALQMAPAWRMSQSVLERVELRVRRLMHHSRGQEIEPASLELGQIEPQIQFDTAGLAFTEEAEEVSDPEGFLIAHEVG